jgi:hypothetical protein
VFVSDNNGPFTPFMLATTQSTAPFTGVRGHTYGFYSVATDQVGHREQKVPLAEATTNVAAGPAWQNPVEAKDSDPDTFVVPRDVLVIFNELNAPRFSDPITRKLNPRAGTERFYYDVNGDEFVTPNDALIVINFLTARTLAGEGESRTGDVIGAPQTGALPALPPQTIPGFLTSISAPATIRDEDVPRHNEPFCAAHADPQAAESQQPPQPPPTVQSEPPLNADLVTESDPDWDRLLAVLASDLIAASTH